VYVIKQKSPFLRAFCKYYSSVFFLTNYNYDFNSINLSVIEELPCYKKLKIIKETAKKPTDQSRLRTVAFILLADNCADTLIKNVENLMNYQDNGLAFNAN